MLGSTGTSRSSVTGIRGPRQRQCRRLMRSNSTSSSKSNKGSGSLVKVKVGAGAGGNRNRQVVGEFLAISRWACTTGSGSHSKCYSAKGTTGDTATSSSSDTPQQERGGNHGEGLEYNKGLWKGILCNLNRDGSPQELPPQYVPDALREWGETLYEWNTLCESSIEEGEGEGEQKVHLIEEVKRQVPLTACESVQAQYEALVTTDTRTRGLFCASDASCGNFLLAGEKVAVENDILSVTLNTCFHLSSTTRVRFDLCIRKFLGQNDSNPYHLGPGTRVYMEERVKEGLSMKDFDELDTDGGVRQTNSIANTDRPESFQQDGVQQIGLILNTWLDIFSSSENNDHLRIELTIPKTTMKDEQKFAVTYSNRSLTETSL